MKDVLFYSKNKKDVNSPQLLRIFELLPFRSEFLFFCVDPDRATGKRNDELLQILEVEEVPTLLIAGQTLVGEAAFRWAKAQLRAIMDASDEPHEAQPLDQYDTVNASAAGPSAEVDTGDIAPEPVHGEYGFAAFDDGLGPAPGAFQTKLPTSDPVIMMRPQQTRVKSTSVDIENRLKQYEKVRQDGHELGECSTRLAPPPTGEGKRRRRFRG